MMIKRKMVVEITFEACSKTTIGNNIWISAVELYY